MSSRCTPPDAAFDLLRSESCQDEYQIVAEVFCYIHDARIKLKRQQPVFDGLIAHSQLLSDALQPSNCCHEGNDKAQDAESLGQHPLPGIQGGFHPVQVDLDWKVHLESH